MCNCLIKHINTKNHFRLLSYCTEIYIKIEHKTISKTKIQDSVILNNQRKKTEKQQENFYIYMENELNRGFKKFQL